MSNSKPFPTPSKAYQIALEQLSQRVDKPLETITQMAYDLILEKLYEPAPQKQLMHRMNLVDQQNLITPICPSQLNIIPTGTSYGLVVELDDGYWLENRPYASLALAIKGIKEYEQVGSIQLRNWIALSGEYPVLILKSIKGRAHLWLGQDTACRMWSTSNMKQSSAYKLTTKLSTEPYCTMCVNSYKKIKSPKVSLTFDEQKKLISPSAHSKDAMF